MILSRPFLAALAAAASLFVAGCGGGSGSTASSDGGTRTLASGEVASHVDAGVPFSTFSSPLSSQSAITEQRLVTVRDADAWARLWAEHVGSAAGTRPLPPVDFSRNMVIGVFLGSRSACDTLSIEAVKQKQGPARIEVSYKHTPPAPETVCVASIANPAVLITVPKSDLPVEFVQVPELPAGELVIRSGWSFGFCLDRCEGAVAIDRSGAIFRASSRLITDTPERAIWGAVSAQEWQTLVATYKTLPDVIVGCPDCADEGKEWIEIEQGGTRKRLEFSCNVTIDEADTLQKTVRAIRSRLAVALGLPEVCNPGAINFQPLEPAVFTSDITTKRFVTIRDAASWATLWNEHTGGRAPLPAIDFSKQMVLGVFMGNESPVCGSTRIESVRERTNPDHIEVGYRVLDPGPDVVCIAAVLNQYSLVTVPAMSLPVEFVKLP